MTKQSFYDKIKALGANDETTVNFSWEEGCDVFHYNETHVETAMSETGAAYALAEAVTEKGSVFYDKGNSVIETLREDGLLDEYERGDEAFTDFVAELSVPLEHLKEELYNHNQLPNWNCQVRDGKGNLVTLAA